MTVRADVWPAAKAYMDAVRQPRTAFPGRPDLAEGTLHNGPVQGFPWSASGANAIVFSLTTGPGRRVAVRCFTRRPPDDVDERYRALGTYLSSNPCPVFADFEWMDQAIIVENKPWPILKMEWIDGAPLKLFVRQRLDRQTEIAQLSETWASVVTDLESRQVAHGDLQHGNVIVSSSSDFRLVDLDEVYCASTQTFGSTESGLPAYQHPERAQARGWDHRIDRFSSIVIYVSLRALASADRPDDLLAPGDALVLSADDIRAAAEQNARDEAWEFLFNSPEREVRLLADGLHEACRNPLDAVPSLDEIVSQVSKTNGGPVKPPQEREGTALNPPWDPPVATPPRVDDQRDGETPMPADSKRTRAEPGHQGWTEDDEPHRRVTHQMPQQQWGGQQTPASPPAAGQPGGQSDTSLTTICVVVGVLLLLIGLVGVFVVPPVGLGCAGLGGYLIWWGFQRSRK